MDNFIYNTPTKIYFGKDEENNIASILKEYDAHNVLIVYGGSSIIKIGLLDKIKRLLEEANIKYICLGGVKPNPDISLVYEGNKLVKENNIDLLLAIGGGSVIDTVKDIATSSAANEDAWDYHNGSKKPSKSIKKGAILTISSAGSEMSNSAVLSKYDSKEKRGNNSEFNRLDFAICNPELTYSVSKYQTACGVVDIAMHTIERFFAPGDDFDLSDELAISIIRSVFKYGKIAYHNPNNYEARANLMWASSLAHNGLTGCGKPPLLTVLNKKTK